MGELNTGVYSTAIERGRTRSAIAALLAAAAMLLIFTSPAHALIHHGHTFGSSFGQGFGEGGSDKLSSPSAIAVNEATGDIYVLDTANNRVVRFASNHEFLEAWGYGVGGGSGYEQCKTKCGPGISGFAAGQFASPVAITVDNAPGSPSRGDVYVAANNTWKRAVVDKFSATGTRIGKLIASKEEKESVEGPVVGVAVDITGKLWVEREEEETEFQLQRFDNAVENQPIGVPAELEIENLLEPNRPVRPGFAIDSHGDIYVTYEPNGKYFEEIEDEEEEIKERERERKANHEPVLNEKPQQPCTVNPCLVAKLAVIEGAGGKLEEAVPLVSEEAGENTTTKGVAVNLSASAQAPDDAFFGDLTNVAAFTPGGTPIETFGSEQLQGAGGVAADAQTGEVLVADATTGLIDDYVLTLPGPPMVRAGSVRADGLTSTSALLHATIDANGDDTSYRFQYGTGSCSSPSSACSETPVGELGHSFGDQEVTPVRIGSLTPDTTYHLRVIATNHHAEGDDAVVSEERTFVTLPSQLGAALPDGRAWELVSPAKKNGGSVEPIAGVGGGVVQASSDGRAMTYLTSAAVGENEPEGNRLPERSQILGSRTAPGKWSAQDIATPNSGGAQGVKDGSAREYQVFSTDLREAVVVPAAAGPLSPEETEQTLYLRDNAACAATPLNCYLPIVNNKNDTAGSEYARRVGLRAATPDMRHLVLASAGVPLTAEAQSGRQGIYEWSGGQLQLISILPNNEQPLGPTAVGAATPRGMESNAISADGSRVVWHTGSGGFGQTANGRLYLREVPQARTVLIDSPNTGVPAPKVSPSPEFQAADTSDSKVFFTDAQRLTADATAGEEPTHRTNDLYVFEPDKPAGERLTDLTVSLNSGEAADVQGAVLGASDDGAFVYFVANGVLAEGAQPGACRYEASPNKRCNLYVAHYDGEHWEAPRLITRISTEDSPDWGTREGSLKDQTARVSPNGQYVAFMSNVSLTGYDNADQSSGASDEEVYLYHYGADHPVCASCNPGGERPTGVHDLEESGEGIGLVVDRPMTWADGDVAIPGIAHWLAASLPGWTPISVSEAKYQSRYLSNSGRLFFNSSDSLVPRDRNNGKEDVYEYEPKGLGSCTTENTEGGCVALISSGESQRESAFMDASESADDVFFITTAKLSWQDTDTALDVYDARVCNVGGAEPCPSGAPAPPPPPCDAEKCRPPATQQPGFTPPASSSVSASGNVSVLGVTTVKKPTPKLTRSQQLAAALKKCHKLKQKKKRVSCEKLARKRFGAKKASSSGKAPVKSSSRTGR